MHVGQKLEEVMQRDSLTQADVALAAGVSQATVSRVLRRAPQRSGAAYLRLCSYIRKAHVEDLDGPEAVGAAVRRVWDGSQRHAAALTKLIDASGHLWPGLTDGEDRPSTTQPSCGRG